MKNKDNKLESTTDLTIVPFEFEFTLHIGFRDGYNGKYGSVP
jgi:hypothetical protein